MRVVLIATGGTIASRETPQGAVANVDGAALLEAARATGTCPPGVEVEVRDQATKGSFALTLGDMRAIADQCRTAVDAGAEGVVVTHGTDSMEETAFLTDLLYAGSAPVIFTGAQRTFDAARPDGPTNLAHALRSAADPALRDRGVFIAFDGEVLPARGARKSHTWALHAFDNPSTAEGRDRRSTVPGAVPPGPLPPVAAVLGVPGGDGSMVRAATAGECAGLVFQGTGIGNASPGDAEAIANVVREGTPVLVTSRVTHGPVRAVYGNGGGRTLQDAGAVLAGDLTTAQARVLLAVCAAAGPDARATAAAWLAAHAHDDGHDTDNT